MALIVLSVLNNVQGKATRIYLVSLSVLKRSKQAKLSSRNKHISVSVIVKRKQMEVNLK
jgi:hypothetical protein